MNIPFENIDSIVIKEEKNRATQFLNIFLKITMAITLVLTIISFYICHSYIDPLIINYSTIFGVCLFLFLLLKKGYVYTSSYIYLFIILIGNCYVVYKSGGVNTIGVCSLISVIQISALVAHRLTTIIISGFTLVYLWIIAWLQNAGLLVQLKGSPIQEMVFFTTILAVIISLIIVYENTVRNTFKRLASIIINEQKNNIKLIDELKIAKHKAEESDALKSLFLANMSHEIRTPLNGILGFADLLRTIDNNEKKEYYINIIERNGLRMLSIINDLIDISKIEAKQVELHYENTDVNLLLTDIFEFFKLEASKKQLLLLKVIPPDTPELAIRTDKTKLYQVLTNLIKNALKFTETGYVKFGYKLESNIVKFFVTDTGIGISTENTEIIFERFRQADLSPVKASEGSGLGLTISKGFIELMGGTIWVESEKSVGSSFYFTLPVQSGQTH